MVALRAHFFFFPDIADHEVLTHLPKGILKEYRTVLYGQKLNRKTSPSPGLIQGKLEEKLSLTRDNIPQ
jgi:hypothetical protein